MRKRIDSAVASPSHCAWVDLEKCAQVEVTSEDPAHPIEAALTGSEDGWRASEPGEQVIRFLFDDPQRIRRVILVFHEEDVSRTQEFLLRWSRDGEFFQEIVRQQFNFSPPGTTREFEEYRVSLDHVKTLELRIEPDIGRSGLRASLANLRLA